MASIPSWADQGGRQVRHPVAIAIELEHRLLALGLLDALGPGKPIRGLPRHEGEPDPLRLTGLAYIAAIEVAVGSDQVVRKAPQEVAGRRRIGKPVRSQHPQHALVVLQRGLILQTLSSHIEVERLRQNVVRLVERKMKLQHMDALVEQQRRSPVWHALLREPRFFDLLYKLDQDLAERAQSQGCPSGGRLDRANYPRKPRGGPVELSPDPQLRHSFCRRRDGCRSRTTLYVASALAVGEFASTRSSPG